MAAAEASEVAEELVFFAPVHLRCPLPGPLGVGLLLGLGRRGTQTQAQLRERVQQMVRLILTQLDRTGERERDGSTVRPSLAGWNTRYSRRRSDVSRNRASIRTHTLWYTHWGDSITKFMATYCRHASTHARAHPLTCVLLPWLLRSECVDLMDWVEELPFI